MSRFLGIRHRRKETVKGEVRPTEVAIVTYRGGERRERLIKLADEEQELLFVHGRLPASQGVGLQLGDVVGMVLGGSGDHLRFALSRRGEEIGARVLAIPTSVLKEQRGEAGKDASALWLAALVEQQPLLFYPVTVADRQVTLVRQALRLRTRAQQARIACKQRLYQQQVGLIFCAPGGLYPEGGLELAMLQTEDNDAVLRLLQQEEERLNGELDEAVRRLSVYRQVLRPVTGCGPRIAAGLIVAIGDIRRFPHVGNLLHYLGVAARDGKTPRQERGACANWSPEGRQALYLLVDQWRRRPDCEWGQKLRQHRERLWQLHPQPEDIPEGERGSRGWAQRYTEAHLNRMARWYTLSDFVRWLYSALREVATEQPVAKERRSRKRAA